MNKVIRHARIADEPVRLEELGRRLATVQAGEAPGPDFVSLDEIAGRNLPEAGPDAPEAEEPLPESEPESDEEGETAEAAEGQPESPDAVAETEASKPDAEAEAQPESEPEPEEAEEEQPSFSAVEVERMVEERLKEFEERFQAEKEEAYRSGFEDGKAEGLKEGQEHSRQEIDRFAGIVDDLSRQWRDLYRNTDLSIVDLSMAVSRKIVGSAVEHLEAPVLQAVQECLGYLEDKARVVLKVHPDDLAVVRRHRSDWLESLEGLEQLLIEGDEGISRGGCIVETPKGDVDAQIEERLERLRAALSDAIRTQEDSA